MRRHGPGSLFVACVLASLVACGPTPDDLPTESPASAEISISGTGGVVPELTYTTPLVLQEPVTEVAWEGTGDPLRSDGPVLLRIYSENGTDGSIVRNDFETVPAAYLLTADAIGSELLGVLSGHAVGSRILYAAQTDGIPLVSSIDILPTRAIGDLRDPEPGQPVVAHDENGVPSVTIPADTAPPAGAVVQQVIRGTGEQVTPGQEVVIQYLAVKWSTGEVFDTTWGPGLLPQTVQLGADKLIEGVEDGLVDLPVGSQVLLVVPPDLGFGPSGNELSTETLVYVVDILAVSPRPS